MRAQRPPPARHCRRAEPLLRNSRALRATITAFLSLACVVAPVYAQPQVPSHMSSAEFWMSGAAVQGGLIIGRAPKGTRSLFFNDASLELSPDGYFLIGFDRDASIEASLVAILADGSKIERNIAVAPGNWRIENVAANITGGAKSSAEFQARRSAELAQIEAARAQRNDAKGWRQTFIRPLSGRISGLFGAQRIYNGTPGSYHNGMDIAAPQGRDFVAPADGVVTLAANDAFTLEGHLLMIDHGMGLNSAFLHASELLVKAGDHVRQGQVIGRVGATGRATGPHLHWGMKWNSARIDPKLLLPSE